MYYIYNEGEDGIRNRGRAFHGFTPNEVVSGYVRHYGNWLYLRWILEHTEDWREKFQAEKEMAIAEGKLEWWSKRPGFDFEVALPKVERLKRDWNAVNIPDKWSADDRRRARNADKAAAIGRYNR